MANDLSIVPGTSCGTGRFHWCLADPQLPTLGKVCWELSTNHKTIATCSQISMSFCLSPTSKAPISPHQNQKHFPPQLSKTPENLRISLDFHHFSAVGTIPWAQLGWFHLAAGRFLRLRCCLRRLRRRCRSAVCAAALGEAQARRVRTREPQARTLRGRRPWVLGSLIHYVIHKKYELFAII